MADVKISGLPSGSALAGTEVSPFVQAATTVKILASQIATYVAANLGTALGTSFNKVTITPPATGSTLTITDGKTFAVSNTLTLTGTDSTSFAFPSGSSTVVTLSATQTLTNKTLTAPAIGAATGTSLVLTAGITTLGGAQFHTTNTALTDGAGVGAGTITTAPAAGNPTKWIGINDNGTVRYIPAW